MTESKTFSRYFSAIHKFFFVEIDPFVLGLFRLALGGVLLLYFFMLYPNWIELYGPGGLSIARKSSLLGYRLFESVLFLINTETGFWVFYWFSVLMAVCFTLGVFGRLPVIWLWIANFSIMYGNHYVANAEEQVFAVLLFFSMFLPLNAALNIHQLRSKSWNNDKVTVWALRPLQLYIAGIYLFSWPIKVMSDEIWVNGLIVYYAVAMPNYSRWPDVLIFGWADGLLSRALGFYTLFIELVFPLLVWFKKFRIPCVLGAMFLQFGLGLLLSGVAMFTLSFGISLILFLPSEEANFLKKT